MSSTLRCDVCDAIRDEQEYDRQKRWRRILVTGNLTETIGENWGDHVCSLGCLRETVSDLLEREEALRPDGPG